ncbi:hypothetical protein ACFQZE_06985 [Paenibacillus sp. GCM10027627]|uniref:hypothetical protein n=1 Tax=unclassified Paenibacillus TaxID=185978 RepID=UPI0036330880
MIERINEELELIKKLYVNNGEYQFRDDKDANKFAVDLYWNIHNLYSSNGYYHKFETILDFIYSHHADSEAYWFYKLEE